MTPEEGQLVTVLPHRKPKEFGGGFMGRWHGRVRYQCRVHTDWWWVQEVKAVNGAWAPGMTTQARADHFVPIDVQLDLFGNPTG